MADRVLAAMSGGVDSSVAAWLLREQGYELTGVTMKLYDGESAEQQVRTCCSLDDVTDARAVARRLGIPYYVFNFTDEFSRRVIDKFTDSYLRGETPNPCIDCNRYLKFGKLLARAEELGIDLIATGHYARITRVTQTGRLAVMRAADKSRDQSYVLACLSQEQLRRALFPLGELTKEKVREIAAEQGFPNAGKSDSQDICFVPDRDYGSFIERYTGSDFAPGDIISAADGRVLGHHRGAARYTRGQRRGLGVSSAERIYVTGKSMEDNTVTLGPESELYSGELIAGDVIWGAVSGIGAEPLRVQAMMRYRQRPQDAWAFPAGTDRLRVRFDEPQRAITVGQTCVLYADDIVLASGTIRETS